MSNTKMTAVLALNSTGALALGEAKTLAREYRAMEDKEAGYGLKRARVAYVLAKRGVRGEDGVVLDGKTVGEMLGISKARVSAMRQELDLLVGAGFSLSFKGDPSAALLTAYRAAVLTRKTSAQGGEGEGKAARDERNATLKAGVAAKVAQSGASSDVARAELFAEEAERFETLAKESKSPKSGAQATSAEKSAPEVAPSSALIQGINAALAAVQSHGGTMSPEVLDRAAERLAVLQSALDDAAAAVAAALQDVGV